MAEPCSLLRSRGNRPRVWPASAVAQKQLSLLKKSKKDSWRAGISLGFVRNAFLQRLQLSNALPFRVSLKRHQALAIAFEPGGVTASLDFEPLPRGGTAQQRSTAVLSALVAA